MSTEPIALSIMAAAVKASPGILLALQVIGEGREISAAIQKQASEKTVPVLPGSFNLDIGHGRSIGKLNFLTPKEESGKVKLDERNLLYFGQQVNQFNRAGKMNIELTGFVGMGGGNPRDGFKLDVSKGLMAYHRGSNTTFCWQPDLRTAGQFILSRSMGDQTISLTSGIDGNKMGLTFTNKL